MLVFHTILPLKASVTRRQCVDLFIQWVANEERLPFAESDFADYNRDGREEWSLSKDADTFAFSHYKDDHVDLTACELREQGAEVWKTNCVYVNEKGKVRLTVQTQFIGSAFSAEAPAPRVPALVKLFIQADLCDKDGAFEVSDFPIIMTYKLVESCARSMEGAGDNMLPIVYCSKGGWLQSFPAAELARELQGIAHVVVEPKRHLSKKLRKACGGRNVAKGRIGIYLPGAQEYKMFRPAFLFGGRKLKDEIIRAVHCAWFHADADNDYTWERIAMFKRWKKAGKLDVRTGALGEAEEMIGLYEEENAALTARCKALEEEAEHLNNENARLLSRASTHGTAGGSAQDFVLRRGREPDLYPGEQNDFLLDLLEDAESRCAEKTRPHTLVKSILAANEKNGAREQIEAVIRDAFNGNGGLTTERQLRELKSVGFDVKPAGKHHKIMFAGDRRYIFTVASSPSDRRSGENTISEITRRLFYK